MNTKKSLMYISDLKQLALLYNLAISIRKTKITLHITTYK